MHKPEGRGTGREVTKPFQASLKVGLMWNLELLGFFSFGGGGSLTERMGNCTPGRVGLEAASLLQN